MLANFKNGIRSYEVGRRFDLALSQIAGKQLQLGKNAAGALLLT
jgi:hypothetical protein